MLQEAIRPPEFIKSVYGPEPRKTRAADLPGIVSLGVRDLFPDITPGIYQHGDDPQVIRKITETALASVDKSENTSITSARLNLSRSSQRIAVKSLRSFASRSIRSNSGRLPFRFQPLTPSSAYDRTIL